MKQIKTIAVFCGASNGFDPRYSDEAVLVGKYLAQRNITMVFGGGKIGLMGAIAGAVLENGGKAVGVIPEMLRHEEVAHDSLDEMIVTENMSERKLRISRMVDAYLALPGGFGTLDEIFEALTLGQLGVEDKPVGLLNINGFFDPLLSQLDKMVEEGFLRRENREMIQVSADIEMLCRMMRGYIPPGISKIVDTVGS